MRIEIDVPWAITLETMALKKISNESVFNKIREELWLVLWLELEGSEDRDNSSKRNLH